MTTRKYSRLTDGLVAEAKSLIQRNEPKSLVKSALEAFSQHLPEDEDRRMAYCQKVICSYAEVKV